MSTRPAEPSHAKPGPRLGRTLRLVRPLMGLLALGFVAFAAKDLFDQWEGSQVSFSLVPAAVSLIPLVGGTTAFALSWKWLLERMSGGRLQAGPVIALHLESQLARYIPGKLGVPLVRVAGASKIGVAPSAVGTSVLLETASLMGVGGLFSFAVLALTSEHAAGVAALLGRWAVPVIVVLGACVAGLLLLDRRRLPNAVLRALGTAGTGPLVPPILPLVHLCYWALWATHGYLVSRAVGGDHAAALASTGLYTLAPVVGFLALVAPAGFGVREALLAFGLTPAVGPAAALSAALISRAVSLVGDVGTWLCFRPYAQR